MAGVDIMYLEPTGIGFPFRKHITAPVGSQEEASVSCPQLPREGERAGFSRSTWKDVPKKQYKWFSRWQLKYMFNVPP